MSIIGSNIDDTRNSPRESRATQLGLDEELTVHDSRSGVERRAGDRWVDVVLSSDGVSDQEPDNLELVEVSRVSKASEDLVGSVCNVSQSLFKVTRRALTDGRAQEPGHRERPEWLVQGSRVNANV